MESRQVSQPSHPIQQHAVKPSMITVTPKAKMEIPDTLIAGFRFTRNKARPQENTNNIYNS